MAKNQVNIELKATGQQEVKAALDQTAQASANVGQTANEAGRQGAEGMKEFSEATAASEKNLQTISGNMTGFLAGMASLAAAVQLVTSMIEAQNQAIKEHGEMAVSQVEALTRLQFLGDFYRTNPQIREEVVAFSEYGRRPFEEVAGAYYNLRSSAGNLTEDQQREVMMQALEIGRMDRQAPLDQLIGAMTLYANKTGETNMDSMQNVILRTVDKARSSFGQMAQYMPAFLSQGMAGGMSGAEAAGLWAYASNQLNSPAEATTALKGVFEGLQGNASPEAAKLLKRLGVDNGMSFFDKIETLGAAGLDYQQAGVIAGTYSGFLLDMIRDPKAMMGTIGAISDAANNPRDLARDSLDSLMGSDERARLVDQTRYYEMRKANAQGESLDALRYRRNDAAFEADMARNGYDETFSGQMNLWAMKKANSLTRSFGVDMLEDVYRISINNAPITVYARPGEDPTPRIGPQQLGAEEPK